MVECDKIAIENLLSFLKGAYMKIILCIDERRGMMFNQRRQSRDRVLIDDMLAYIGDETLCISPYSSSLFEGKTNVRVVKSFSKANAYTYCFIEDADPCALAENVDEVVLYHWNRHYPADRYFQMDLRDFTLTETVEFAGSSHEKITREVWKK